VFPYKSGLNAQGNVVPVHSTQTCGGMAHTLLTSARPWHWSCRNEKRLSYGNSFFSISDQQSGISLRVHSKLYNLSDWEIRSV